MSQLCITVGAVQESPAMPITVKLFNGPNAEYTIKFNDGSTISFDIAGNQIEILTGAAEHFRSWLAHDIAT